MTTHARVTVSFLCGVLLTFGTTLAALYLDHPIATPVLLWPVSLMTMLHNALMGPGPVLYHDEQGRPVYEGSPVLLLVFGLGLLLAVPIYWGLSYLALRYLARRKGNELR